MQPCFSSMSCYFKKLLVFFLPFIHIDKVLLSFSLVRYKDSWFSCSLDHPSFNLPQFLFYLFIYMIRIMHGTICQSLCVTSTVMLSVQPCYCGSGFPFLPFFTIFKALSLCKFITIFRLVNIARSVSSLAVFTYWTSDWQNIPVVLKFASIVVALFNPLAVGKPCHPKHYVAMSSKNGLFLCKRSVLVPTVTSAAKADAMIV